MINKISSILILTSTLSTAHASPQMDAIYSRLLSKHGVGPRLEQAYCYTDEKGQFHGVNIDKKMRIASVSKVITSLWAIDKLGPNYTYDTKFFIKDKHMHIKGAFDPFMSNEKMIYIISSLNKAGFKQLDKITFDNNIRIFPSAQLHKETWPELNPSWNKNRIELYFNTNNWTPSLQADYKKYSNLAPEGRYVSNPTFSVKEVSHSEKNPFGNEGSIESDPTIKVLTLKSPKLYRYLKEINVKSNNYASQTVFEGLGGARGFKNYLQDTHGIVNSIDMYTGSGLPDYSTGSRRDNLATCRTVANLTSSLKESLERQGQELEDVVAVPGSDAGTFRNRLNSEELKNTFVAKTGTLNHVSTLAGALNTKKGYSFFGIYNATENIYGAKSVQNEMVKSLFKTMGGSKNFNYKVEGFLPYDKNGQLKSFLDLDDLDSNFSEIDEEMIIE